MCGCANELGGWVNEWVAGRMSGWLGKRVGKNTKTTNYESYRKMVPVRKILTPYVRARALPIADDISDVETSRNQHSARFSGFGRRSNLP